MSNYILTLQIETFYSLYRFGKIAIDRSGLIPVLGQTEDGMPKVDQRQFVERFPQFVDDDFYVILECDLEPAVPTDLNFSADVTLRELCFSIKKVSDNSPQTFLRIEDVINIFPLTDRASIILKGRLKEEINLGKPVFQDLVAKAQQESERLDISSGALALSSLCGIEDVKKNEKLDSVIFEAVQLRKEGSVVSAAKSLLFHSLVYDRHEPFPNNNLGIFYDLNKIMSDIFRQEHSATNYYKYLEKLEREKNDFSLYKLIKLFEDSVECKGIKGKIIEKSDAEKDYVSILLFLKYRDELRHLDKKKGKIDKMDLLDDLAELKSDYSLEIRDGVYLLGGFFSYEYFIDDYYTHRNLRIFSVPPEVITEQIVEIKKNSPGLIDVTQKDITYNDEITKVQGGAKQYSIKTENTGGSNVFENKEEKTNETLINCNQDSEQDYDYADDSNDIKQVVSATESLSEVDLLHNKENIHKKTLSQDEDAHAVSPFNQQGNDEKELIPKDDHSKQKDGLTQETRDDKSKPNKLIPKKRGRTGKKKGGAKQKNLYNAD